MRKFMLSEDCGHWQKLQIYLEMLQAQALFRLIHKFKQLPLRTDIKEAIN